MLELVATDVVTTVIKNHETGTGGALVHRTNEVSHAGCHLYGSSGYVDQTRARSDIAAVSVAVSALFAPGCGSSLGRNRPTNN